VKGTVRIHTFLLVLLIALMGAVSTSENAVRSVSEGTSTGIMDYPQQDGGSDDRLFQYRSMWLEGYQIINHSEVQKVIQVARDSNINCVTPLINAHYLGTFYNSSYHPRYRDLAWDFDPTMDLIREAHKYGIKVMPWFHTMIDPHAISLNPEWGQVTSSGSRSGSWLNPSLPEVQRYLGNVTYQLFRDYPLDGIHLDACRYPSSTYGYDDHSIALYYEEGWDDFNAFRREQMTKCMISIHDSISRIRPYVWIGADIGSSYSGRENSWFQDSDNWSEMGKIDFVTPMIYTLNGETLESYLRDNIAHHSCPVICGNYVYVPEDPYYGTVPDEETGIAILQDQTERAICSGALGTCFFAYKFLADHPGYHRALREGVFAEKALCPLKEQTVQVKRTEWWFDGDQDTEGWRTTGMGNYYPVEGFWSVIGTVTPSFMSPLLEIDAGGTNLMEISLKTESTGGNMTFYWSPSGTMKKEGLSSKITLYDDKEWHLYSIHLDENVNWSGNIDYLFITFELLHYTNITIDYIRISWVPYCIRGWGYLGPFYSGESGDLLDRDYLGNESSTLPRIGIIQGGREWKRYGMERDQVDLRFVLGHLKDAVTYAHIYIISEQQGIVEMRSGNSDGIKVWLNGREVLVHREPRRSWPDQDVTFATMKKGVNTLLLKLAVYTDENAFYMRFTGPGNETIQNLKYYDQLPLLQPPTILEMGATWLNESSVVVSWDPPVNSSGLDHYELSLDGAPAQRFTETRFIIDGLPDGIHSISLRCVDNLGFSGYEATTTKLIDTAKPSGPHPFPLSSVSIHSSIQWKWEIPEPPISGFSCFMMVIEKWDPATPDEVKRVESVIPLSTRYELKDDIKDGYIYRLGLISISGSRMRSDIHFSEPVLVDLSPPSLPGDISFDIHGNGTRICVLNWTERSPGALSTLNHYEVFWKVDNKDWVLHSKVTRAPVFIERPSRSMIQVKIKVVDVSSQESRFSDELLLDNIPPEPRIIYPETAREGDLILVEPCETPDPDGEIISYRWYIYDVLFSMERTLAVTLEGGSYPITLEVTDDLGATTSKTVFIEVFSTNDPIFDTSLSGWIESTSYVVIEYPPLNISNYNNRTVIGEKENEPEEKQTTRVLTDFLITSLLISMFLLFSILMLMVLVRDIAAGRRSDFPEKSGGTSISGKGVKTPPAMEHGNKDPRSYFSGWFSSTLNRAVSINEDREEDDEDEMEGWDEIDEWEVEEE